MQNDVVDDGTDGDRQQLQREVDEYLAEGHFADDDGGQTNDDSAPAHVDVGGTLELGQQTAGQGYQTVGHHESQHHVGVGIDALSPGHVGICAGGTEGAALFRAEKPVQNGNEHHREYHQQRQGVIQTHRTHIPLGYQQIILIHAYCLIGLAAHDPQVDGVEGQLGQNTGQNGGDAAFRVEQAGDKAGQHTCQKGAQQRGPSVQTCPDQHDGHGTAGGQRSVHRQISYIQNTEGDVDADGHQAPDQALGHSARQRIEKGG